MSDFVWCCKCNEKSALIKVYTRKSDGRRTRVEYCTNHGCRHVEELKLPQTEEGERNDLRTNSKT